MLFLIFGVDEDVVDEHNHELVEVLHEHLIHHPHEVGRGVGQSKRHHGALVQSVSRGERSLGDIALSDLQLIVSGAKINLGEYTGTTELVKQIIDSRQRLLVLYGDFVEGAVVDAQTEGTIALLSKQHWQSPR